MKFNIVRSVFLEGLQKVQNVVATKPAMQILQNALLTADEKENRLTITTTDMDISERCAVECEIESPGSTTLPIRRLCSIISGLSGEKITVDVDDENNVATVQCGSFFSKLNGMSMRDFPVNPESSDSQASYSMDQGVFKEMLRMTFYAAALDDTRKALNGVLLSFFDNKLTMVATDGRRMALVEHEVELPPLDSPVEMILPIKAVSELIRILASDGEMKIVNQKNQAVFDFGTSRLCTKLVDGKYPNFRQVIPGGYTERVDIEREKLLGAIRVVSLVADAVIRLTFSANQLTISTASTDVGEARDVIPIKYAGKEITLSFNPAFLIDPLKVISDDDIYFELEDGSRPALIKCSVPFLYLLMPLRG
ncbi:MAG: DNA polymerase III subunit beta [Kiritimatiellae bacterium]|nr:DNA polymerase III subunit beta [Kiritimatiellia bacterium]